MPVIMRVSTYYENFNYILLKSISYPLFEVKKTSNKTES